MEYALVDKNNKVVQKVLNGDHRFPVHSDLKWIRCNSEVGPGWTFYEDTNAFTKPTPRIDPMVALRRFRDSELKDTDWRMQSDYPHDDQEEWKTYRQALRDMTSQTPRWNDDERLVGIEWPTDPNGNKITR